MTDGDADRLYPNRDGTADGDGAGASGVSRRGLLAGSATAGAALAAGCSSGSTGDASGTGEATGDATGSGAAGGDTVFVFNTDDATVSVVDPERDEVVDTQHVGLSASFPSNQHAPELTTDGGDPLWLNVNRGVRALAAGTLSEVAHVDTGSGSNWQELTPDGEAVVVSAREPAHTNYRIDADRDSETFGEITGEIDRTDEGGRGDREGPGPCDVTVHPDGAVAFVPDLFGDTLTVIDVEDFAIETQVDVAPVGDGANAEAAGSASKPWMGTVAPGGDRLLVEHQTGTESVWDTSDPASPELLAQLTPGDGLGEGALTSEIGPDSRFGYVFTPGTNDVSVVDIENREAGEHIDLGGAAFVGTWGPSHEKLYVPIQTNDEVAVIDHASRELVERIPVGAAPYGATAARVRPETDESASLLAAMAAVGLDVGEADTTYCIGNCACGHQL